MKFARRSSCCRCSFAQISGIAETEKDATGDEMPSRLFWTYETRRPPSHPSPHGVMDACIFELSFLLAILFSIPVRHNIQKVLSYFPLCLLSTWWIQGEPGRSRVHGGANRTGRQDASDDHLRRERDGPGTMCACPGTCYAVAFQFARGSARLCSR